MTSPRPVELLAPARDRQTAIEAIRHGADAVYIGASSHGARQAAANSVSDIAAVADFAHLFNARVYITLNTLVYDNELRDVERLVKELYKAGADALIVQDMAILGLDIPPIALHASTQCDTRTPEKALFLAKAGFSQIVVPRELSLDETAQIHKAIGNMASIEAFVHGALCVSYSGDCQAGFATSGRSANRGCCPQICRHSFNLVDEKGNILIRDKHVLSLRDLNRSAIVAEMMESGVQSFKIEGRLKDAAYVKNTVAAYRRVIDNAIAAAPGGAYRRSSEGTSVLTFIPDLNESFNRGYTEYFSTVRRPEIKMASADTPKWTGVPVGTVISCNRRKIKARLDAQLSNGDGLGYFDSGRNFHGFRLNRVDGNMLFAASDVDIQPGTPLFRNHNRLRQASLEGETAQRTIAVDMTLRPTPSGIALDITDESGMSACAAMEMEAQDAQKPQTEARESTLRKTGDTIFHVNRITDLVAGLFIPLSLLSNLRRQACAALAEARKASRKIEYRKPQAENLTLPESMRHLTYHDNIANRMASDFYRRCGAESQEKALEASETVPANGLKVMTTRYCLRREMGRCLRTGSGKEWPRALFLESGPLRFRLDFDCTACEMSLTTSATKLPSH